MMVTRRHSLGPEPGRPSPDVPLYGFQPPVGTPYGLEVTTVEDFSVHHDDWLWNPPVPSRPGSGCGYVPGMCSAGTISVPHEGRSSSSNQRCSGPTPPASWLRSPLTTPSPF
jgi:hypothetical protein